MIQRVCTHLHPHREPHPRGQARPFCFLKDLSPLILQTAGYRPTGAETAKAESKAVRFNDWSDV